MNQTKQETNKHQNTRKQHTTLQLENLKQFLSKKCNKLIQYSIHNIFNIYGYSITYHSSNNQESMSIKRKIQTNTDIF